MKPPQYQSRVQQAAFLKGATARLDELPRESPYVAHIFTAAFFDGWDRMDRAIWEVAREDQALDR